MATTADAELLEQETPPAPQGFFQTQFGRNLVWGMAIAAVVAVMIGVWLWSQQPTYKVLFANFSDRDGGAIVASLQQMNVPYKYTDGGSAILIPSEQVHDVRLKLAAQGLPKGGNVGFELMENQKLGISQFLEQVNFQRALEGELARSIQSVGAVQSARVHLALPKPSVFVRDQQKPTASVILNLHPGRTLEQPQVSAIVHLVASSVPELQASNVTVVDQNGSLISEMGKNAKNLDPNQLKYVQQLQMNIAKQVESIVAPIVGPNNVRAEATADVDFSQIEQAAESYKPNSPPAASAIRSQQTSEANNANGTGASGVPGALSNQPPTPGAAPVTTATTATGTPTATTAATSGNGNTRKDSTTNFEVDKTIRYTQQAMGGLRRLSVAVIVNYKRNVDKSGKVTITPLSAAEKQQITDLVKDAMGFSKDRNDSLSVLNTPFDGVDKPDPVPVPVPWWKDRDNWELGKELGRILLTTIVLAYLFFKILLPLLRPVFRKLDEWANPPEPEEPEEEEEEEITPEVLEEQSAMAEMEAKLHQGYRENLQMAKNMAKEDPRVVANVVKAWVGTNE
jgi:flagellar M-ring protein FliF